MLKKIFLSTLLCTTVTTPLIGKVYAEEVKDAKPVKYVFKSGGMRSPIGVNYDGSMTVPEQDGEILEIDAKPVDFYIYKDGVPTNEINPKYKYIWDQWGYYDFYKSKGRVNDLFVGEHPRPLDGVTYDPKSDKLEPNKNTTDDQSKSDQPKQDVPAKVEQPAIDNAKVDKNSDTQSKVVDKKDTDDQNKVVSDKKAVDDNQKSETQSSDFSKKVDVKKEDINKDVKAKSSNNKAKSDDNKSDKQQKELPKTGESDNSLLRVVLLTIVGISLLGIYRISRKVNI
ncbi:LPXTG cell wall anchor domain-containing protein [Mammaliicoccus sciuri]